MTIKESGQTAEETDRTASMPEPGSMTRPVPERVKYPMPSPDPDTTSVQDLTDETETDDQPALATDDAESEDDTDLEPAADERSGAVLVAGAAASTEVTDTPDPDDEVDLRVPPVGVASEATPMLGDSGVYEERWNTIQISFVDAPRHAVQNADRLVTEAMEDLARIVVSHRDSLQSQWRQDDHIDTERMRLVFQEYRRFLHGLLSA